MPPARDRPVNCKSLALISRSAPAARPFEPDGSAARAALILDSCFSHAEASNPCAGSAAAETRRPAECRVRNQAQMTEVLAWEQVGINPNEGAQDRFRNDFRAHRTENGQGRGVTNLALGPFPGSSNSRWRPGLKVRRQP